MAGIQHRLIRTALGTAVGALRTGETNIRQLRRMMDLGSLMFFMPWGVDRESVQIGGRLSAEWLIPQKADHNKVMLYLHGGGYAVGSKQTHRSLAGQIAKQAGYCGLLVEYRLAPEDPHPAALEDALLAYEWLLETGHAPEDIVIAGDSAGGGLATATMLSIREKGLPQPSCGVLISPWVDLTISQESVYKYVDRSPMIFLREMKAWARNYAGIYPEDHPLVSPLYADLHDLPPLLIQLSDTEVLVDEGTQLAEKARAAGVDVTFQKYKGLIHVWQIYWRYLPQARDAITKIVGFIDQHSPSDVRVPQPIADAATPA